MVDSTIDVKGDIAEVSDQLYREEVTDGLPVIPPTSERVEAMVAAVDRVADASIGTLPPRNSEATVEKIAVNAVMSGCKPPHMRVLVPAVDALAADAFNLYGINATTNPVAPMLLVNGPVVDELNVNYGYNVFGPGWRSNATMGRAIRLILRNIAGAKPGEGDRSTHGHPGKYTYCVAENERANPWTPFHVERGYDKDESTVTVIGAEAPKEITDHVSEHGEGILQVIADTVSSIGEVNAYFSQSEIFVVLGPDHAEHLAADGWTKSEIQRFLYDHARNRLGRLQLGGLYGYHNWPKRFDVSDEDAMIPMVTDPSDIWVLVAGGAGKYSTVLHSYAHTDSITNPVLPGAD